MCIRDRCVTRATGSKRPKNVIFFVQSYRYPFSRGFFRESIPAVLSISSPQRSVVPDSASAIFGEAIRKRGTTIEQHRARGRVFHVPSAGVGRAAAGEDRHGILEELQHSYVEDSAAGLGVSLRGAQRVPLKQGSCANDSTLQAIFARQHVVRGRHRARCLADRVCYRLSTLFSPPKTTYVPACAYHIYPVSYTHLTLPTILRV